MADTVSDGAVGTPKKRNRPPRKKQKNDFVNKAQNSHTKNSPQTDLGKAVKKVENPPLGASVSVEVNKHVSSEKKNNGQRQYSPQKKKPVDVSKRNSDKGQRNVSPSHRQEESFSKNEYSQQEKMNREDKRYQMELERRQMGEERAKRWYHYFLSKPNDLITLDRNYVAILHMVEKAKPQAQFVCKVCNYYCDNISVVGNHIRNPTHISQLQGFRDETTLRELPPLTPNQTAVLNACLLSVVAARGMSPSHLETRRTIGVLVSDLVSSNLKGCTTRLFGSSIHGLGLNTSDVNIDLQVPKGSLPPAMLQEVASLISQSCHFKDVEKNFDCEIPYVGFTFKQSGEQCSISLNNERAVSLAILLSKYTPLDPRLTQLATLFRLWGKLTKTDRAQDGTWPGYAFYLMTIFYLQQCKDPVLPVLNDFLVEKGESESANTAKVLDLNVSDIKERWRSKNKKNLAALWIGLLKFYTIDFNYTDFIVSIDSSNLIPRKTRKIFIVDPFLPTRNVARSITSNPIFYYIMDCLMISCLYFGIPQSKFGALFGNIYDQSMRYRADLEALLYTHNRINSQLVRLIMMLDNNFNCPTGGVEDSIAEVMQLMRVNNYSPSIDNIPVRYLERSCAPPRNQYKDMSVSASDAELLVSSFNTRALEYHFTADNCTGGQKLPLICGVCKREGHLKNDCPEERLPPLEPLPPLSPQDIQILDNLCNEIFEVWKQSKEDLKTREKICDEIQTFIRASLPTANLELFGSTKNGFGLKGSDMDMCLTFSDNKTGEGLDTRSFIEVLFRLLKPFKGVQDLLAIATAKVPIVKFSHKETRLDGDISLYNVLAVENSKLLAAYSQIDIRVRILGYMMKRFSKVCNIGDASKGSLSSYAYTLMVIYFLQQCSPPVLPVLQELTDGEDPCPKHIVEGYNAYFFHDLTKLDKVWPGRGQNKLSVGELWLSLLIFYTEKFDLLNNVIAIRSSRTMTKFEKLWISKGIAIEDPFDLSHNLGSALTRKMSLYIIKAFRKGRNHFGRPVRRNFTGTDIVIYYLNPKDLTDGEPPNDRGCRICKSIGHKERMCPEKKKSIRGKRNKKKQDVPGKQDVKKDAPVRKPPFKPKSGDEEDEDDEDNDDGDSESDKGSSDFDDEVKDTMRPFKRPTQKMPEVTLDSKQFLYNTTSTDQESKGLPAEGSYKIPGFIKPDLKNNPQPHFRPFLVTVPQNTQTHSPKIPNIQNLPVNANPPMAHTNPMLERAHTQLPNCSDKICIPTIVFKNSNLASEPVCSPINPIQFPISPDQEPLRPPPPGFIPLSQNGQPFPNTIHFPPDQKAAIIQNSWKFEGPPAYVTNPNVEILRTMPIPPAFNNLRFTGMLAPAEQLIWGQAPTLPVFPPADTATHQHTLNAAVAKLQLNNISNTEEKPQGDQTPVSQDFPKKESHLNSSRNKPIKGIFPDCSS